MRSARPRNQAARSPMKSSDNLGPLRLATRTISRSAGALAGPTSDWDDLHSGAQCDRHGPVGEFGTFALERQPPVRVQLHRRTPRYKVSLVGDSTERGNTGVSFSSLHGLSQAIDRQDVRWRSNVDRRDRKPILAASLLAAPILDRRRLATRVIEAGRQPRLGRSCCSARCGSRSFSKRQARSWARSRRHWPCMRRVSAGEAGRMSATMPGAQLTAPKQWQTRRRTGASSKLKASVSTMNC